MGTQGTTTELRFPSSGWKFYSQGITVSVFGIGLAAWGVVTIVVDPWNWIGVISMLGGVIATVAGVVLLLLVWFMYGYGIFKSWRDWKQFSLPSVVLSAAGAHYRASRRSRLVPWPDVEEVSVKRTIFPGRTVTKVSIRLTADAALIREGIVHVPASRYLNVGLLSECAVPEDLAVTFLAEIAGQRFQLTEIDRRPADAGSARH